MVRYIILYLASYFETIIKTKLWQHSLSKCTVEADTSKCRVTQPCLRLKHKTRFKFNPYKLASSLPLNAFKCHSRSFLKTFLKHLNFCHFECFLLKSSKAFLQSVSCPLVCRFHYRFDEKALRYEIPWKITNATNNGYVDVSSFSRGSQCILGSLGGKQSCFCITML